MKNTLNYVFSILFYWYFLSLAIAILYVTNISIFSDSLQKEDANYEDNMRIFSKKYESIFEKFKVLNEYDKKFLLRNYIGFQTLKRMIIPFIIGIYSNNESKQTLICFGIFLISFFYTILVKPFKKKGIFVIQIINDFLQASLFIIIHFYTSSLKENNKKSYETYGKILFGFFFSILGINILLLFVASFIDLKEGIIGLKLFFGNIFNSDLKKKNENSEKNTLEKIHSKKSVKKSIQGKIFQELPDESKRFDNSEFYNSNYLAAADGIIFSNFYFFSYLKLKIIKYIK